jgi:RNA polymerase sigma-70 factor, ECF subfamily
MTISAQTFDEHKRVLWGMCYRMTGSAADADDIVQDTFVRALEKPPTDMEVPLRPWLIKVAMNLSRDNSDGDDDGNTSVHGFRRRC